MHNKTLVPLNSYHLYLAPEESWRAPVKTGWESWCWDCSKESSRGTLEHIPVPEEDLKDRDILQGHIGIRYKG